MPSSPMYEFIYVVLILFFNTLIVSSRFSQNSRTMGAEEQNKNIEDFTFSECDGLKSTIRLISLNINPKKLSIPSNITVSIIFNVTSEIRSPISIETKVYRQIPILNYRVKLPCIFKYGSCRYRNICDIYDKKALDSIEYKVACPEWLRATGFECTCPIKPKLFGVEEVVVPLKSRSIPKWITKGEYRTTMIIEDKSNTVACYKFQIRLV